MDVKWKLNGIFNADAGKVYEEIQALPKITPEAIVEKAANKDTEMHKCFLWDDAKEAYLYRLHVAGNMIRMLVVVPEKKEHSPRRVLQISSETHTYQPVQFFHKNEDEYAILLERAKGELRAIRNRYAEIAELEEVFAAIDNI